MNGKTKTYSACKDNLEQYQVHIMQLSPNVQLSPNMHLPANMQFSPNMQFSSNRQVLFLSCCLLQLTSLDVVLKNLLWSFISHIILLLACGGCHSRPVFLAFVG